MNRDSKTDGNSDGQSSSVNNSSNFWKTDQQQTTLPADDDVEDAFIGTEKLKEEMRDQLKQFEEWFKRHDWLAFHENHYDWWMFPIDLKSNQGRTYQLPDEAIRELRDDKQFIADIRRGVFLMVYGWGWDVDKSKLVDPLEKEQKWSCWPIRLYKAGRCMWLFRQHDYYKSLKALAYYVRDVLKEDLTLRPTVGDDKDDVFTRWKLMEEKKTA